MDKPLKVKLTIVGLLFLTLLVNHKYVLFLKPHIYSHYSILAVIITGISIGMIFSVVVYNFAIFFYTKDRQNLYYALAELSVMFFLFCLEGLYLSPFAEVYHFHNVRLHAFFQVSIVIFTMLFIREFLQTKEIKQLDMLVKGILFLSLIDIPILVVTQQNVITSLVPIFVLIWLVVSESHRLIAQKSGAYYLFYVSWNIVIFVSILTYTGLVDYINKDFPFLHIAFAVESILLSLALTYKIKLLQDEKQKQQSLLLQQARLASMGEMVASIAHQWKQPLTHLSYLFMNIKKNSNNASIVENKLKEANTQLKYMSKTIDAFRNFYNPSKVKKEFSIKEACSHAVSISHADVEILEQTPFTLHGNQNEFEQVVLNILNNAKEAKEDVKIKITIDRPTVTIEDNAGGIEKKAFTKVFEPYFSTKKDSDGIGLYIAKTVIEKEMKGKLYLSNTQEGACFKIVF